jgi:hypothetical protein
MTRLGGLALNAAGVLCLWFGGVPYKTQEKLIDLGPIKATTEVERKVEVPPYVGAGMVAVGSALLLMGGGARRKS